VGIRVRLAAAIVAAILLGSAAQASAEQPVPNPPWPQALPAVDVPNTAQPHGVPNCRKASIRCVDSLAKRLRRQWQGFDATCDHRAVISYAYLQITNGLRDDLAGPRSTALVHDRRWMEYLIAAFSNRYFAAFNDWAAGRPVPYGWQVTFEQAAHGDVNAGQDTLLFSNVHVQHDLPFAMEQMGLRTPSGASRKHDHDAVNEINARVFNPIADYIAAHYDPAFTLFQQGSPLDGVGTLELVKSWREQAWRSSEQLLLAKTPAERAAVVAKIDQTTNFWANFIASGQTPGYHALRDQYCLAHRG
jgi:hypothetical protein